MPPWVRAAEPLVLTAAHESKGFWYSIDADATIFQWLVAFVVKRVAELD